MTTATDAALRRLLLLVVLVGAIGLIAELLLLEHYEEWTQWLPIAVLAVVAGMSIALWLRPAPRGVLAFRAAMLVTLVVGMIGLALHFNGNREFELEMDGGLAGWPLLRESLRGATPALAPGAMIQLALLGLVFTWRHPALVEEDGPETIDPGP